MQKSMSLKSLDPNPSTPNPKPEVAGLPLRAEAREGGGSAPLNLKPSTLNSKPQTLIPKA